MWCELVYNLKILLLFIVYGKGNNIYLFKEFTGVNNNFD